MASKAYKKYDSQPALNADFTEKVGGSLFIWKDQQKWIVGTTTKAQRPITNPSIRFTFDPFHNWQGWRKDAIHIAPIHYERRKT
mmetsp:Transcript_10092/g.61374  ORF Transcript_10092/g.61374 Transcript_10092/m.61374 type:complete len:84 (+) Transcript_10092:1405-1656(+)